MCVAVLKSVVRMITLISEKNVKESRKRAVYLCGNSVPGRENDSYKGLEVEISLIYSKNKNKMSPGHSNGFENK